jgi:hypothetical protein
LFCTLSTDLQIFTLTDIFHHAQILLVADDEALAYALGAIRDPFRTERPAYSSQYAVANWRSPTKASFWWNGENNPALRAEGWMQFLQGKSDSAIASFEADLKELRRNAGKRNAYFGGLEGLFFILALLQSEETGAFKKIDDLLDAALARHGEGSSLAPSYRALKAVVSPVKRTKLRLWPTAKIGGLNVFFCCLPTGQRRALQGNDTQRCPLSVK